MSLMVHIQIWAKYILYMEKIIIQKLLQSKILLFVLKFLVVHSPSIFSQSLVATSIIYFWHYTAIIKLMFFYPLTVTSLSLRPISYLFIHSIWPKNSQAVGTFKMVAQWINIPLSIFLYLNKLFCYISTLML